MSFDPDPTPYAPALLEGLATTPHLVALFDAQDRLLWCNRAFADVYAIQPGTHPTWVDIMRRCHRLGCGTMVQAGDFEAWLASAAGRRGKQAYRACEGDIHGGQWISMAELMLADGSMLCIAHDVTSLRADERTLRQARDLAQREASSDPLTGLGNRRHVMDALAAALLPPRRTGSFVALVDLDHFKRINDAHGHQGGDLVLRDFARVLMSVLRRDDVIGRIGGEEFLVLLPGVGEAAAEAVMQRLLQATRASVPLPHRPEFGYRCSIGLLAIDDDSTLDALLHRADEALYAAKAAGRDRCVLQRTLQPGSGAHGAVGTAAVADRRPDSSGSGG